MTCKTWSQYVSVRWEILQRNRNSCQIGFQFIKRTPCVFGSWDINLLPCSTFCLSACGSAAGVKRAKMAPRKPWSIFTAISWTRAMKYLKYTNRVLINAHRGYEGHCSTSEWSAAERLLPHLNWVISPESFLYYRENMFNPWCRMVLQQNSVREH